MRLAVRAFVTTMLSVGVLGGAAGAAAASPRYDTPFPCGQQWLGTTRDSHSPSPWAVDFNREGDELDPVVASVPGVVTTAKNLGDTSYGKFVVVDHGGGFSTVHAHLARMLVVVGQTVDTGAQLGLLGNTGNSYGAHLHYEQRHNTIDQRAAFNGVSYSYGTSVTSSNCPSVPITGDWNADGRSDMGAFVRDASSGRFRERASSGKVSTFPYGSATDTPLVGDWNGDGTSDVGSWRAVGHQFMLRLPNGSVRSIPFGRSLDVPITGHWDGNKKADIGVWRPARATFFLRSGDGSVTSLRLGSTNDIPLSGDWEGDGIGDVGVYEPTTSTFTLRRSNGSLLTRQLGMVGDLPVTGDWDGNGSTEIGVWTPSTATFSLRNSQGTVRSVRFGATR